MADKPRSRAARSTRARVLGGGPRAGLQLAARPARGLRGVHQEPGERGLEADQDRPTTMAACRAARWSVRRCNSCSPISTQGLVDIVVVYKVDRLTRSLADFAKMVEMFDARGVSFVAVTQQFNTTTSMGRLTLNVLLSFAQFEREVTGERIRDKIAASKRKGMWMGGVPPLGYDVRERRLVVNPTEADTVRFIYERYLELGCVRQLSRELHEHGIVSKVRISKKGVRSGGCRFSRGALYELLANPIHIGEIRHKQERYPGQHEAIVPHELWERVQQRLRLNAARGRQILNQRDREARWRERSSMRTESRSMRRGRQRRGGGIVTTYLEAWLTVPRAMTGKAGDSLHPSSNERWRLPRSTSSAIAPGCWRCWNGRGYNRPT